MAVSVELCCTELYFVFLFHFFFNFDVTLAGTKYIYEDIAFYQY